MSASITVPAKYVLDQRIYWRGIVSRDSFYSIFPGRVSFGWVIAAIASTAWLGLWQTFTVIRARKAAGIAYPQGGFPSCTLVSALGFTWSILLAYAEKAEVENSEAALRFNCAQRKLLFYLHVHVQEFTRHPQVPTRIPLRTSHTSSLCQLSVRNGPSRVL